MAGECGWDIFGIHLELILWIALLFLSVYISYCYRNKFPQSQCLKPYKFILLQLRMWEMSVIGLKSKVLAGCVHSGCSKRESIVLPFLASRSCLHFSTSSKPAKWDQVCLMLPSPWFSLSLSSPLWLHWAQLDNPGWSPYIKDSELTTWNSICNLNSSLPYNLTYSQFLWTWTSLRGHSSTYHI